MAHPCVLCEGGTPAALHLENRGQENRGQTELTPIEPEHTSVPEFLSAVNLLMQCESGRQCCLKMDWFAGDGVVEFQKAGVQEISSIAGEAGEIFKRLAG
jgi:hypothetical protein